MEELATEKLKNIDIIRAACDIVKSHMIKKKVVLYGGQAIDYALRVYGLQLYEDYQIPDYDFLSNTNVVDIYDMFVDLIERGYSPVSALAAYHPETMRLRLYSDHFIADSSYVPLNIYNLQKRTAIKYEGVYSRHPYIQYGDQHGSLAAPFAITGTDYNIIHRYMKDHTRFKLLYSKYSVDNKKILKHFINKGKFISHDKILQLNLYSITQDKLNTIVLSKKEVNTGIGAFYLYETLYDSIVEKSSYKIQDKIYSKYFLASTLTTNDDKRLESNKFRLNPLKQFGDLMGKVYQYETEELVATRHKNIYVEIDCYKVICMNGLIVYFYHLLTNNYSDKTLEFSSYILSAYLRCLKMYADILSMIDSGKNINLDPLKKFLPLGNPVGIEVPNKIIELLSKDRSLMKTLRPPEYHYRADDPSLNIKDIISEIPKKFDYDEVYFT